MKKKKGNLEDTVGMLCSDIAGTLLHLTNEKKMELKEVDKQGRKIHVRTCELLQQIRDAGIVLVLVTGMREKSYISVKDSIPHDYAIIEHGGIILKAGVPDLEWHDFLKAEMAAVNIYKGIVQRQLPVDDDNRKASFRLLPDPDEGLTSDGIITILRGLETRIPKEHLGYETLVIEGVEYVIPVMQGVKLFLHTPKPPEYACIEAVPKKSGKRNAITFVAERYGMGWGRIIAFGDDNNDVEMLSEARYRMTFGNSRDEVRKVVRGDGSFITPYPTHEGTINVLEHILGNVVPSLNAAGR